MWQPRERRKHALPVVTWPTAAEAARARLFSPIAVGPHTARERTWVPAMVPWRATDDGFVTPDVIDWYRRFAEGKPGVIVVEATGIRDIPSGPLLRIGHDRFVPGLQQLTAAVREASEGETLLFIQCIDFLSIRRRPPRDKYLARFLTITQRHRNELGMLHEPEADVRARLAMFDDAGLYELLDEREREDLERG